MTITELLRLKEKSKEQQKFYENTKVKVNPVKEITKTTLLEYDPDIKGRAMTIGSAYSTAVKITIALLNPFLTVRSALATDPYFTEEKFMITNRHFENNPVSYLRENFYHKLYQKITTPDIKLTMREVADASVYFAWHKGFLKSGFWPSDLEVLDRNSDTHEKLVDEVIKLLESSERFIVDNFLDEGVVINPTYNNIDLDIHDGADLYANNTLYVLTSTENIKNIQNNIYFMKGLLELNNRTATYAGYTVNTVSTYFVRYDDTLEVI